MKKTNPLAMLLLALSTLGLYVLFWEFKVAKVLNKKTRVHIPSIAWLIAPLLITLGSVVFYINEASKNRPIATSINNGIRSTVTSNPGGTSASLFVLITCALLFITVQFYWQLRFAQSIKSFTHTESKTWASFLLLFSLPFIGIIHAQNVLTGGRQRIKHTEEYEPELEQNSTPVYSPRIAKVAIRATLSQQPNQSAQRPVVTRPNRVGQGANDIRDRFRNYTPQPQAGAARPMPVF